MKSSIKAVLWTAPLWPTVTHGLGIRIADQDTEATARGNAFAATADNASAIYYNPAGITQITGQEISAGIYGINLHSEYTSPTGTRTETKNKFAAVPEVFYAASCKDYPFSAGLGFYSPYGLGLEWPDNSAFRAVRGEIRYLTVNPVVAWRITDKLSIAGGATLNYADTDFRETLLPGFAFPPGGQIRFKGDDTDVGFNAGIFWHPVQEHAFGVTYYSATTMKFRGTSEITGATLAGVPNSLESAKAEFKFPQHVVAGWSYRPSEKWNLEFDIDWTDWDSLNTVTLVGQNSGNTPLPFNWRSSFFYEFGVTRYLPNDWRVSAGYIYSENSVPDANFSPLVPDSDRHIFSFGIGKKYQHLAWNLAYQLAWGPERDVTGASALTFPVPALGIGTSPNGRYTFLSHALSLNARYFF